MIANEVTMENLIVEFQMNLVEYFKTAKTLNKTLSANINALVDQMKENDRQLKGEEFTKEYEQTKYGPMYITDLSSKPCSPIPKIRSRSPSPNPSKTANSVTTGRKPSPAASPVTTTANSSSNTVTNPKQKSVISTTPANVKFKAKSPVPFSAKSPVNVADPESIGKCKSVPNVPDQRNIPNAISPQINDNATNAYIQGESVERRHKNIKEKLTKKQMLTIEKMIGRYCDWIIFDSSVEKWEKEKTTFNGIVKKKGNLIFVFETVDGRKFGWYIDSEIRDEGKYTADAHAFLFKLEGNELEKYPVKSSRTFL